MVIYLPTTRLYIYFHLTYIINHAIDVFIRLLKQNKIPFFLDEFPMIFLWIKHLLLSSKQCTYALHRHQFCRIRYSFWYVAQRMILRCKYWFHADKKNQTYKSLLLLTRAIIASIILFIVFDKIDELCNNKLEQSTFVFYLINVSFIVCI